MRTGIGPGIGEITGLQRWIIQQELRFGSTQSPGLHEEPYGDPGTNDARIAAADTRRAVDTRKGLADIASDDLQ